MIDCLLTLTANDDLKINNHLIRRSFTNISLNSRQRHSKERITVKLYLQYFFLNKTTSKKKLYLTGSKKSSVSTVFGQQE